MPPPRAARGPPGPGCRAAPPPTADRAASPADPPPRTRRCAGCLRTSHPGFPSRQLASFKLSRPEGRDPRAVRQTRRPALLLLFLLGLVGLLGLLVVLVLLALLDDLGLRLRRRRPGGHGCVGRPPFLDLY